jgi:hypothetical protein
MTGSMLQAAGYRSQNLFIAHRSSLIGSWFSVLGSSWLRPT